jgi:hypothetical protein
MSAGYATASLDTLPTAEGPGDGHWKPLRRHFGITAFGVNAWVARGAGDEIIAEHDEEEDDVQGHEELYLVTRGSATFTIGDEDLTALAGTLVFVRDPQLRRKAVAEVPGTTIVSFGGRPDAMEVSAWERRRLGD